MKPNAKLLNDDHMNLEVMLSYQPPKGRDLDKKSNMAILEIALPSGFVANDELLNGLKAALSTIKRIETKNSGTVVIIYFDYLTMEPVYLNVDGFREHIVDEQKPSSVLIYDYYDNGMEHFKYKVSVSELPACTHQCILYNKLTSKE